MTMPPSPLRKDHTHPADLSGHARGTGATRTQRPRYVDRLPPCNAACPAGEDIQGWLGLAQAGHFEAAWRVLVRDNPLPAVHGRVCYHPCESACNRAEVDAAVSVHAVERFLGDRAIAKGWKLDPPPPPPPGSARRRVLVVGAGPSGLSAAYHLARMGHEVEVRDGAPVAGGMLQYGIPAYRLPRAELAAEVRRIEELGVRFVLGARVDDVAAARARGRFDAVFVAVGAHLSKRVDLPSRDAGKVLDAVTYLHDASEGRAPTLGRRVAVYGGGNTAMDAARTAQRLGAEEALIIYRRDLAHMPAHPSEAAEATTEGVKIHWLRTIHAIEGAQIHVERMALDARGVPQPTGELETLEADALILALGQDSESACLSGLPAVLRKPDGTVQVDSAMMTGEPGVFAGGDMVPSERTVTVAVGHGKRAAKHIDAFLRGTTHSPPPKHPGVTADKLHTWFSTDADARRERALSADERLRAAYAFEEVVSGLGEPEARFEAARCFSCGNCFECDGCYAACPEQAIVKLGVGRRYRFDFERCTGCAVCFEQCPCHAIELIAEEGA
ncbi:MAG: NAD(P)-binding protein [Myxococcales bacterium]|nr:NAD(P)-binding protein [Myxococcales bacterium]HQY64090.1 NAD(P)-binding protein [Polyangiaceae bacterium]